MSKRTIKDIKDGETACANCLYFEKFPIQQKEENVLGACKASYPIPSSEYNSKVGEERPALGVWPLVLGTFWCGMFYDQKKRDKG